MADITICRNIDCSLKEKCYRYKAIPDKYYQSYGCFLFKIKDGQISCNAFAPILEGDELNPFNRS